MKLHVEQKDGKWLSELCCRPLSSALSQQTTMLRASTQYATALYEVCTRAVKDEYCTRGPKNGNTEKETQEDDLKKKSIDDAKQNPSVFCGRYDHNAGQLKPMSPSLLPFS